MDTQKTQYDTKGTHGIAEDDVYFKYIFKKTEKIVCSVFYILNELKDTEYFNELKEDVMSTAQGTLDKVLASLSATRENCGSPLMKVAHALMGLESKLRLLHASRLLSDDLLNVFVAEIDTVLRTIKNYNSSALHNPIFEREVERPTRRPEQREVRGLTTPASRGVSGEGVSSGPDRRARIRAVVREKGQASIKDISDVVTDCSEKTIQRELNAMIKDGIVVREGERRWSRYSVA